MAMTTGPGGGPRLEDLSREECCALTAQAMVGRVAVPVPGDGPLVVPVNYVLDGEEIVFRSDPGSKLWAAWHHPISFQIDSLHPVHRTGWSVLIRGKVWELFGEGSGEPPVEPWAGGEKPYRLRLRPTQITGRRIVLPEVVQDPRGYL